MKNWFRTLVTKHRIRLALMVRHSQKICENSDMQPTSFEVLTRPRTGEKKVVFTEFKDFKFK